MLAKIMLVFYNIKIAKFTFYVVVKYYYIDLFLFLIYEMILEIL